MEGRQEKSKEDMITIHSLWFGNGSQVILEDPVLGCLSGWCRALRGLGLAEKARKWASNPTLRSNPSHMLHLLI